MYNYINYVYCVRLVLNSTHTIYIVSLWDYNTRREFGGSGNSGSSPTLSLSPPDIPACGRLHDTFPVSYILHNRTQLVQELEARISTSEAFMYSGKKLVRMTLLCATSLFIITVYIIILYMATFPLEICDIVPAQ